MKRSITSALVAGVVSVLAAQAASASTDLSAARRGDAYSTKKTQCKAQARQKNFGVHFVKRNRWVKNCIAS